MRSVTVQFLKNPDLLHWGFEAFYLGEDEWGDWIALPAGTRRWKGKESFHPTRVPAVFCAPREAWWHLHYEGPNAREYQAFVDIITPPVWVSENRYEMIDLDLDVAVHQDGTIEVQDEDEFEVHQVKYGYTPEMISGAVEETERIVREIQAGREPFYSVAEEWLARV
jgi:protein associated with RNAse G/E